MTARADGLTITTVTNPNPDLFAGPRYQITTSTGRTLHLTKETFGDSPALIVWALTGYPQTCHEFDTKTEALAFAAANPDLPPPADVLARFGPGTCRDCLRRRQVASVMRYGSGNYRTAGHWRSASICAPCATDIIEYATANSSGRVHGWDVGALQRLFRSADTTGDPDRLDQNRP